MTESHDTGLLPNELDPERPNVVDTPWGTLALYRVDERWVAADAWCPHMLGPLHQGTRCGTEVVCPWHGWRFDLEDGRRTDEAEQPDAIERELGDEASRIQVLETRVGPGGRLWIDAPRAAR